MSFGREAATYYPFMQEIAEDARLKYFADLRPNYTYTEPVDSLEGERVVDVVALAVQEYPSQSSSDELLLVYYLLELDARGWVVDDWCYPDDLGSALSHVDGFPGVEWEELKLADGEARPFIRSRLTQPPRR
jgi:hypothetical protein